MKFRRLLLLAPAVLLAGCQSDSPTDVLEERAFNVLGGLEVGGVLNLSGESAENVILAGGTGTRYLVVPFFASRSGEAQIRVSVTASNVLGGSSSSALAPAKGFDRGPFHSPRLQRDEAFHMRFLRAERALMARLAPRVRASVARRQAVRAAEAPKTVGDTILLNANPENACSDPTIRAAVVKAVSQHTIIAVDPTNPAGGLSDTFYREVAAAFDTLVYPVDTETFGDPADIDENGKVIIFYTRAVNELTPPDADFYVGGFFWVRDLLPRVLEGDEICPASNEHEMFYMLAPDPEGVVNGNEFSTEFVEEATVSVTGHEFEHLINASRRIYVNNADDLETAWLDEGLAHIAEERLFYHASGLSPQDNITIEDIRASQRTVDAFNEFGSSNIGRYWTYLEDPSKESLMGVDTELETRGAIWAFLRYAADHLATDETAFFHDLVNANSIGLANLQGVLGADPVEQMQRWTVSVYTDDFVANVGEEYQQPSWNFRNIIGYFNDGSFPLKVASLAPDEAESFTLKGGGAAFALASAKPDQLATITTTGATTGVATDSLRVSVVRVQ